MKKRILCFIITFTMVLSGIPMMAYAADGNEANQAPNVQNDEITTEATVDDDKVADEVNPDATQEQLEEAVEEIPLLASSEDVSGAFTLTYDRNGADGNAPATVNSISKTTVAAQGEMKMTTGAVDKNNIFFKGWNTAADGSGDAYAPDDVIELTADTTLYAQWGIYVAKVTDKDGRPINVVDAEGNVIDTEGRYETLQAAINAVPKKTDAVTEVPDAVGDTSMWKVGSGAPIYTSEEAAKAAVAASYKITMLEDFSDEGTITGTSSQYLAQVNAGQVIVLDLVGHTVSLKVAISNTTNTIVNNGDLTVMDSTDTDADGEDCGMLTHEPGTETLSGNWWSGRNYTTNIVTNNGTFTLESGTLLISGWGNICYTLDTQGTANIKGGLLKSEPCASIRVKGGTFNMSGGTTEGFTGIWVQYGYTSNAKINISGGNIFGVTQRPEKNTTYAMYDSAANSTSIKTVTYKISGGHFVGDYSFYTAGANTYISGGEFDGGVWINQKIDDTNLHVSGGIFHDAMESYGNYPKKQFVTGGNFVDFPNYDTSSTYYFGDDGLARYKYTVFEQLPDDTKEEFKCYQDYIDGGCNIQMKAGVSGYILNDDFKYESIKLQECVVYRELPGGSDKSEYVDTIYIVSDSSYTVPEEQRTLYRYTKMDEYALYDEYCRAYNYHSEETYNTFPSRKTDGTWGYIVADYNQASTLAYSSSYLWGYYTLDNLIKNGYITDQSVMSLDNFWKKVYKCEYKGMETYQEPMYGWDDDGNWVVTGYKDPVTFKKYTMYTKDDVKIIAPGYVAKTREDGTFDVVPVEIDLGKAEVNEETGAITIKNNPIEVDRSNGDKEEVDAETAAALITNTLVNGEVSDFLETNINGATTVEAIKEVLKAQAGDDEAAKENIENASWEDGDIKTRVDVDLTKAVVSDTIAASTTTSVTTATFDVKPVTEITVFNSEDQEVTFKATITNDKLNEGEEITFRLPVNKNIVSPSATIYHDHDGTSTENEGKGEKLGIYPIQTSKKGEKFIELSAKEFSLYTYEILDIADNSKVMIVDAAETLRGFETLEEAVASYLSNGNEDDKRIVLLNNCASVDFGGKTIEIDLNGYKLMGSSENATNVTIVNENEKKLQMLAATGVYANDVSAYVADGFDIKTTNIANDTIIATTGTGVYQVVVAAETGNDRVADNDDIDLFAGDYVSVQVKVKGARFVAADVTLNYDSDLFDVEESPSTMWDEGDNCFQFYNAKSGGGYYPDGYVLGTFLFKAKAQTSNVTGSFNVTPGISYVSGAWSEGWNSGSANALGDGDITNASANIVLKNMTASVTPINGQSYKSTELKLLQPGYSAVDSTTGKAITDATITYAYLTKAEVDGTLVEGKTDEYMEGKEPRVPADEDYTSTIPAPVNAGEYVVFYKVAKDGYVTVSDKINVSIDKAETTITWNATGFTKVNEGVTKDHEGNVVTEDYYKEYENTAAALPVAEYDCLETNHKGNATVEITTPEDATELKSVGSYTVTASLSDNYKILNPTCKLLIDGALIKGYDLQNADANNDGSVTDADETVWYDGNNHVVAQLVKETTLVPAEESVTIKYSLDGGEWQDSIPSVKEVGKYELKMKITADSYYDFIDTVNFEIKNVEYKVEKTDYVTGWDLVLVYTNDAVPGFTYTIEGDTTVVKNMYNVSDLGYEHDTVWNAAGTAVATAGTHYTHVYGLVVFGDADITKVVPSNEASITINRNNTKNRYDVNNSNTVDINDLVAVQGTYNVGADYLNDEQMSVVLRADVSGNKKVDTYDCSLIKLNSGSGN